jgi:hypothetical protein
MKEAKRLPQRTFRPWRILNVCGGADRARTDDLLSVISAFLFETYADTSGLNILAASGLVWIRLAQAN